MKKENEMLRREMLDAIKNGGAWFCTRKDKYLKIGYSEADDCYVARECFIKEGALEGGAYTFGTDWFDISFHGRYIDIYVDPETVRRWNIWYDPEKGTCYDSEEKNNAWLERVFEFCRQADAEALNGINDPYMISGADFSGIIPLSE